MEQQLVDAVNRLEIREIITALEDGAHPDTCLEDGTPILHLFVGGEHMPLQADVAEVLISYGASVNKQGEDGSSALHIAASWGRIDMIHLLVCNGADVDLHDEDGCTPADVAANQQHASCEQWLRSCSTALVMDSSVFYVSQMEETETDDYQMDDETTILVEIPEGNFDEEVEEQDGSSCSEPPSVILRMTDKELRESLMTKGVDVGPLSASTRPLYVRYLYRLEKNGAGASFPGLRYNFPNVLSQVLLSIKPLPEMSKTEEQLRQSFAIRDDWREGISKTAFNYILIDPRQLPDDFVERSKRELGQDINGFRLFVESIFYIGKGKRSRPYQHLKEAITDKVSEKVARIRDIWSDNRGVISLHVFQSAMPVEAYTREACMIEALGLAHLTNVQRGQLYSNACTWSRDQLHRMGIFYLHRAFSILLIEGLSEIKLRHFKSN